MLYAKTISAADKIFKASSTKQTVIERYAITSSADGNLTLSDGTTTLKLHVAAGFNGEICIGLPFKPGADITLTPSAEMTPLIEYTQK